MVVANCSGPLSFVDFSPFRRMRRVRAVRSRRSWKQRGGLWQKLGRITRQTDWLLPVKNHRDYPRRTQARSLTFFCPRRFFLFCDTLLLLQLLRRITQYARHGFISLNCNRILFTHFSLRRTGVRKDMTNILFACNWLLTRRIDSSIMKLIDFSLFCYIPIWAYTLPSPL